MAIMEHIPREIEGWRQTGEVKTYDREGIFEYIDGAGEVYRLYDFREVTVIEFAQQGFEPVLVEVFDMGSAGDAYGIFTFYHEGKDIEIGQGGYLRAGLLSLWQGKYYIAVSTDNTGDEAEAILLSLGQAIAKNLPREGAPPAWLQFFPDAERRPQSLRYVHTHQALNYHLFFSEKNILQLDNQTEVALAQYRQGPKHFAQIWVRYPDSAAADTAFTAFATQYPSIGKRGEAARDDEGKWSTAAVYGRFLALVIGTPTKADADSVRQAAERKLREVVK